MNALSPDLILGLSFALAFIFALIGQKTHFCTMGAVADIVNMGDWSRMRMWLLAIGVAWFALLATMLARGGPLLLDHVDLAIEPGERIALIGRNGAGKSTLLKLLSGELRADDGEVRVDRVFCALDAGRRRALEAYEQRNA